MNIQDINTASYALDRKIADWGFVPKASGDITLEDTTIAEVEKLLDYLAFSNNWSNKQVQEKGTNYIISYQQGQMQSMSLNIVLPQIISIVLVSQGTTIQATITSRDALSRANFLTVIEMFTNIHNTNVQMILAYLYKCFNDPTYKESVLNQAPVQLPDKPFINYGKHSAIYSIIREPRPLGRVVNAFPLSSF